ncbi:hypothetical protein SAMN04488128_10212 [Chitinophaga eiseniae]|uniref:Uncharacterized protein n=1 Tax=Chitinophaga eiseniae TaxID=634771 RepID=A0A1T4PUS9_9BACT|nr:hypothetical protein SAMN04488128_10212 [Chitinophaga eiseniae]
MEMAAIWIPVPGGFIAHITYFRSAFAGAVFLFDQYFFP